MLITSGLMEVGCFVASPRIEMKWKVQSEGIFHRSKLSTEEIDRV